MKPKPFRPEAFGNDDRFVRDRTTGDIWHRCTHRTLYADTDRSEVVYHSNYLRYFELGRASLMRGRGLPVPGDRGERLRVPDHRPGHHVLRAPLLRRPHLGPHPADRAGAGAPEVRLPHHTRGHKPAHLPRLHQALRPQQCGQAGCGGRKDRSPMEDLPEITRPGRRPAAIPIRGYLRDHVFRGRAVYPAVEAMQLLAGSVRDFLPGANVGVMANADFSRFLEIAPGVTAVDAFTEVEVSEGSVAARLVTLKKSGKTNITRALEHVSLEFPADHHGPGRPAPRPGPRPRGNLRLARARARLRRACPVRPGIPQHTQTAPVAGRRGRAGRRRAPPTRRTGPLGSPFPLDATFHAALRVGPAVRGHCRLSRAYRLPRHPEKDGCGRDLRSPRYARVAGRRPSRVRRVDLRRIGRSVRGRARAPHEGRERRNDPPARLGPRGRG